MNDATLIQLKILVEQVVRPVRASTLHKRKIREELLAHMTTVFEEEIARSGNEAMALERTQARFGDPAELTVELQQTISLRQQVVAWLDRLVGFRPGESTLRRATRLSSLIFVLFGALCLAVFIPQHRLYDWPLIASAPILVFCTTFLMHGMRRALCRPAGTHWVGLALVSVAAWLLIPSLTLGLCWFYSHDLRSTLAAVCALLLPSVLAPLTLVAVAPLIDKEYRETAEWAGLKIPGQGC